MHNRTESGNRISGNSTSSLKLSYCPNALSNREGFRDAGIMLKVDKEICHSRVSLTSFLEDVQSVFQRKKSITVVVRNCTLLR